MSRLILFFQSKIALAMIGTVLFGGGAALIAASSFSVIPNQSTTNQAQTSANISANRNGTSTPSTSGTSSTPTATPKPRPPTPTPGSGQATNLRGTVTSVNTAASLFTVRLYGGAAKTIIVQTQTTFQGACTALSGMHTGWQVVVKGKYQADGSFVASNVTSSWDN